MPFTPFHVGPALLAKAVAPRHFSLTTFLVVQVAIDVESAWNLAHDSPRIHTWLHTLVGALALAALLAPPTKWLLDRVAPPLRRWLARGPVGEGWAAREVSAATWTSVLAGASVGALSHVGLDLLVHPDVHPFAPWHEGNPWYVDGSFLWVHLACAVAGVAGLILWRLRNR